MRRLALIIAAAAAAASLTISPAKANLGPGTLPLLNYQHWTMTVPYAIAGWPLVLYWNYGQGNQTWVLVGPHSNGTYHIRSYTNGNVCVDEASAGAQYRLQTCDYQSATQEFFAGIFSGGFQFENSYWGDCISDDGGALANNTALIGWGCEYPVPYWQLWGG